MTVWQEFKPLGRYVRFEAFLGGIVDDAFGRRDHDRDESLANNKYSPQQVLDQGAFQIDEPVAQVFVRLMLSLVGTNGARPQSLTYGPQDKSKGFNS